MYKIHKVAIPLLAVLTLVTACGESDSLTGSRPVSGFPTTGDYTWRVHATAPEFTHIMGCADDDIYALTFDNVIFHFDGTSWLNTFPFPDLACYAENNPIWVAPDGSVFVGCNDFVYKRDGQDWIAGQLAPDVVVAGIWGLAQDNIFAVGSIGAGGNASAAVFHYDGSAWTIVQHGATKPLSAVSGSQSGHVFAVGEEGEFLHYDGSVWSTLPAPTTQDFNSVWVGSDSVVVAVGNVGTIVHFDGSGPESKESGTTRYLHAVWGFGPDDIYIGGETNTMIHYDGDSWTPIEPPDYRVHTLWGSPDGTLYAGTMYDGIRSFDGSTWTTTLTMRREVLYGLWGATHNDVYATSWNVVHYDGTMWSESTTRLSSEAAFSQGVSGTSSSDVWVVWSNGSIQHFDGVEWSEVPNNTETSWLSGVWAAAPNDAYAIGGRDELIHWDGYAWSTIDAVKDLYPTAIEGAGSDRVFVVGLDGDIRMFDGGRWEQMRTGIDAHLADISVADENSAYVSIQGGGMLVLEDRRWYKIDTPVEFNSIWASAKNEVFGVHNMVGDVYRWNGARWGLVPRATRFAFKGVIWGYSRDAFWVVGAREHDGVIIEYELAQ